MYIWKAWATAPPTKPLSKVVEKWPESKCAKVTDPASNLTNFRLLLLCHQTTQLKFLIWTESIKLGWSHHQSPQIVMSSFQNEVPDILNWKTLLVCFGIVHTACWTHMQDKHLPFFQFSLFFNLHTFLLQILSPLWSTIQIYVSCYTLLNGIATPQIVCCIEKAENKRWINTIANQQMCIRWVISCAICRGLFASII